MNAFYNWSNDEIMITERIKEIQCESEQVNLLHTAGLDNSRGRLREALGNALIKLGEHLRQRHVHIYGTYKTTGSKYAV